MPATKRPELTAVSHTRVIGSLEDVVVVAAESRLLRSSYAELRNVSCKFHEGILTLQGRVPRYYLKQVAQNVVGRLNGVTGINNQLKVTPGHYQGKAGRW